LRFFSVFFDAAQAEACDYQTSPSYQKKALQIVVKNGTLQDKERCKPACNSAKALMP
jgi:hypothetical protein